MNPLKFHEPRRVFIGIALSKDLQDSFVHLQGELGELPGKFIPPEDIHLTLVPPFETRDVLFTQSELQRALGRVHTFKLEFIQLDWGPDRERPRLAWVECAASDSLIRIKKRLLEAFNVKEHVPFVPHMTLARFRKEDAETVARWSIRRPIPFSMSVESVELFSSPHKGGSGYDILTSVILQPEDGVPY